MERSVGLIDTTLRDGQQSLWATRMTTGMVLPVLPIMDRMGFEAIEFMATVVMDSSVRYLREDPWERMRLVRSRVRHTPLAMMAGNVFSAGSLGILPDDVLELFFQVCGRNGIDRFFLQDGLNDQRNLRVPVTAIKNDGRFVYGGLTYSVSPVHTDEYFMRKVADVLALGVDAVVLKDPNGLLTPERVRTLVPALKQAAGAVPVYCHSHCNTGMGPASNLEAVDQGASGIWTAMPPLANGASLPSTTAMAGHLTRRGYDVGVDLSRAPEITARFERIADRFDKPKGQVAEYDPGHYQHQMPGGMISNFRSQLAGLGLEDRLQEVFEEIPSVRADLGWTIMVTPFSQMLATQAALNVLYGRYEVVPTAIKKLALGYFGETPAPVDPDLIDRIAEGQQPTTERPGDVTPPILDRVRRELGPFDSDEDLILAALFMPEVLEQMRAAGPIDTRDPLDRSNLVDLVRSVTSGRGVKSFYLSA